MKTYLIGTNEEAVKTIIAFFWAGFPGEEDRFIASIPQKRKSSILEELKKQDEYVFNAITK